MLAYIEEDMRLALAIAGQEQRFAKAVMRDCCAGGEERRRSNNLGKASEQRALLSRIALGAGIGDRVDMRHTRPLPCDIIDNHLRQRTLSGGW
jgi:hypothetical protein